MSYGDCHATDVVRHRHECLTELTEVSGVIYFAEPGEVQGMVVFLQNPQKFRVWYYFPT